VIELAGNAALVRDLAAGGVFVPGCTLAMAQECELVVCGAHHRLALPARVVYIDEQRGAGLELIGFSTAMRAQLAELSPIAEDSEDDLALPTLCNVELSGGDDDPAAESDDGAVPVPEEREDEYRTLPVPTSAHAVPDAADPDADPDDDLAVPIEPEADDDQRTVPVWTRSRARLVDPTPGAAPRAAPSVPSVPGVADRPPVSDLGHSDAAFAIAGIEADAAFFDAAPAAAAPARNRPTTGDAAAPPEGRTDARPEGMTVVSPEAVADADREAGPDADPADDEPRDATRGGVNRPALPGERGREGPLWINELGDTAEASAGRAPRHVHERLRGLTLAAQIKLAASGELHERIMLERLYGKNVWESLLRNPRLTPPEVSRIARYGALPRVLLEIILGNATWLAVPEVRRALLANPRLGTDQILKVLRLTPKYELRLAASQTAYPQAVRQAARLLLRSE
jgi:hypothetical protein